MLKNFKFSRIQTATAYIAFKLSYTVQTAIATLCLMRPYQDPHNIFFIDKLCLETSYILFYTNIKDNKNAKPANLIIAWLI